MLIKGKDIKIMSVMCDNTARGLSASFTFSIEGVEVAFFFVNTNKKKYASLVDKMKQSWLEKKVFEEIEI